MPETSIEHKGAFNKVRSILDLLATLLVVVVSVVILTQFLRTSPGGGIAQPIRAQRKAAAETIPNEPVSIKGAVLMGQATAPATLLMFSDFQCPYCAQFARESLPTIVTTYVNTGRVLLAFRPLPLKSIHPLALQAAEAAECASHAGKFWPMHDLIFANQAALSSSGLEAWSASVGLGADALRSCMADKRVAEAIRTSEDAAKALGVDGTPTFFIGGPSSDHKIRIKKRLSGALPAASFATAIDVVLSERDQR
jgi:protein-disulfide isomerase